MVKGPFQVDVKLLDWLFEIFVGLKNQTRRPMWVVESG